jgi:regulator of nonsense transcripts 2
MMKAIKDLVRQATRSYSIAANSRIQLSNDPTLSSLPLLTTFLKSYSRPYLGIVPPTSTKQVSADSEPGTLSDSVANSDANGIAQVLNEDQELVEQETRERFKRMCEGYFESVSKKLVMEHKVFSS